MYLVEIIVTVYINHCLLQHPKFFSAGYASHEGPSEEVMKHTLFSVTLVGEGWDEHVTNATDAHDGPPSKRMTVKVRKCLLI